MTTALQGTSVVVIGGSSGIGLATARLAAAAGAQVTIVGRSQDRLDAALATLPDSASGSTFDIADEDAVRSYFDAVEHVDHVAILAGTHVQGSLADLDTDALRGPVDNRFWGPLFVGKYAASKMTAGGSITLTTGAGVERPRAGNVIVTASAGGSEFLARAMAAELAPVRVNVVRPGIVDTPLLDRLAAGIDREDIIKLMAKRVPLGRIAQPEEIADAILFLMGNQYVTGSTITVDGGASLV